jgi:hypothetical protein
MKLIERCSGRGFDSLQVHQKDTMKYKIVIKTNDKTFVKDRSKSKEHLLQKAESLSRKHPKWKVLVVGENTIV